MFGTLNALFAAMVLFVGGHFLLSSTPLRERLIERLGEGGFRAGYSLVMLLGLVWAILEFGAAPRPPVWSPPAALAWVPLLVMPIALFLVIAGVSGPSPTAVGGEQLITGGPERQIGGIHRVTRHPFLWGTLLWSGAHLLVRGDAAGMMFFGGMAILSLGGMHHIDLKRRRQLGAAWGPIEMTTSLVPFAAILAGRTRFEWSGIGWWRPLLAIVLYLAILHFHAGVFGASPLPAGLAA